MVADKFPIKSEIIYVPMRDGVELCAYIRRPDAEGEFPAIVQYTSYRWFGLAETLLDLSADCRFHCVGQEPGAGRRAIRRPVSL